MASLATPMGGAVHKQVPFCVLGIWCMTLPSSQCQCPCVATTCNSLPDPSCGSCLSVTNVIDPILELVPCLVSGAGISPQHTAILCTQLMLSLSIREKITVLVTWSSSQDILMHSGEYGIFSCPFLKLFQCH